MEYKVGDKVRIKSLEWYKKNKDEDGDVPCSVNTLFVASNKKYLGTIQTIEHVYECKGRYTNNYIYHMTKIDNVDWTDEMIEGLMDNNEEMIQSKFNIGDNVRIKGTDIGGTIKEIKKGQYVVQISRSSKKIVAWPEELSLIKGLAEEEIDLIPKFGEYSDNEPLDIPTMTINFIKEYGLPCLDGYQFTDENGNVIEAKKIVLEKKKSRYPKTFLECCDVLNIGNLIERGVKGYKAELFDTLQKLYICRDAYWKLAGDWKPDWEFDDTKYVLYFNKGEIVKDMMKHTSYILAFPTEEVRDAFYENFKELIEECKELL